MDRCYYLSSCNTCNKILDRINDLDRLKLIDIKEENISEQDLDKAAEYFGSYEAIFSRRARKFRGEGWHEKTLKEADYKRLILREYTFLKRPVFFIGDKIFAGNTKKVVESLLAELND